MDGLPVTVLDCHHEDITHIVDARAVARYERREANRRRLHRFQIRQEEFILERRIMSIQRSMAIALSLVGIGVGSTWADSPGIAVDKEKKSVSIDANRLC